MESDRTEQGKGGEGTLNRGSGVRTDELLTHEISSLEDYILSEIDDCWKRREAESESESPPGVCNELNDEDRIGIGHGQ